MGWSGWIRRRAAWLAVVAVTAAAAVAMVIVVMVSRGDPVEPAAASTAVVRRGTVTQVVSAAGTVEPAQTRGLAFSQAGTVTELNVKIGQTVYQGDVLARIDATDAQDAVDSATSRLENAEAALERAQTATTTCPGGGAGGGGGGGQTGGGPTPIPTRSPTSNPTPGPTAGPTSSPTPGPTTSPTASRTASHHPSMGTVWAAALAQPSGQGTQDCAQTMPSSGDAVLSAQQQVTNAELSLQTAQRQLAGTVIKAPISGRVLSIGGKVGSEVSPGGTGFIVLGDVAGLSVRAEVSEADVGRLAVGQEASITLPNRAEAVTGRVSQIDPAGTVTDRLVRYGALIAFDQASADVLLGQSATVAVTVASASDVLFVPTRSVADVSDGTGAVTVRSDGREQVRSVRIGLRGEQYTEIRDGLVEGDEVVWGG